MIKLIVIIVLTVYIFSCRDSTPLKQINTIGKTKEFLLISKPDSIITNISSIASDIEYIPLQSSAKFQIKAIDKIISRGNKIYINLINNIVCFDDKGHLLYQLYEKGKVKGENVVAVFDFDINKSDTSLIVLYGNKLLHFKSTGSQFVFIKTLKLGSISPSKLDFVPGTNNILLSTIRLKGNYPSSNILINLNRDKLTSKSYYFRRFDPIDNNFWDEFIHYQFDNKLHFKERFNDTIFSIGNESNNFIPEIILNSRLSSTNSENLNNPEYFRLLPSVVKIFELPGYFYYAYYFAGQYHQIFYDKHYGKKYELDTWNGFLKDDMTGGPDVDPEYCSDGKIYTWVDVKELKRYIGSESFAKAQVLNPIKKKELKKLADTLKETDNPVLIVVRLKE